MKMLVQGRHRITESYHRGWKGSLEIIKSNTDMRTCHYCDSFNIFFFLPQLQTKFPTLPEGNYCGNLHITSLSQETSLLLSHWLFPSPKDRSYRANPFQKIDRSIGRSKSQLNFPSFDLLEMALPGLSPSCQKNTGFLLQTEDRRVILWSL